jgi:hypothetical protein
MTSGKRGVWGSALLIVGLALMLVGERVLGVEQRMLGSVLGLCIVLAAVVMRSVAARSAVGDARAVELRLLAAYGGVVVAIALYGLTTDTGLGLLNPGGDAARTRVVGVLSVLWLVAMTLSLSAVLFIELAYRNMPIPESVELRRVRASLHSGLTLALTVIFVLSIGYVATERDVRKDVSYFKTAEPSDGTRRMLQKLEKPVRAVLFYRPGSDVLAAVQPYFAALAETGKLSFQVRDYALAPGLSTKHKVTDNGNVLLLFGEGEEERGQLMRVGSELTEARRTLRTLDGTFQQSFSKLVREPRGIFLTVGHGEPNSKSSESASGDTTTFMLDVLKRLNLRYASLGVSHGLGREIPPDGNAVAIMGPTEKLMPEEVETLVAYWKNGGRLFLMLDPDVDVGLKPLLDALGLTILPGVATSTSHHMVGRHNASDHAVVYSNQYTSHPTVTTLSRNQREVATVFYRGGALAKTEQPVMPKPLITFPLRSTGVFFRDLNGSFNMDPGEAQEALQLMAAVVARGENGKEARAVVIPDGDFMTDKVASNKGNYLLFVDSLAWLIGNEEISGEVSSEEDLPIEHSRDADKLWFYLTSFAVPVPIALLGYVVTRRRRERGGVTRSAS